MQRRKLLLWVALAAASVLPCLLANGRPGASACVHPGFFRHIGATELSPWLIPPGVRGRAR